MLCWRETQGTLGYIWTDMAGEASRVVMDTHIQSPSNIEICDLSLLLFESFLMRSIYLSVNLNQKYPSMILSFF